MHLKSRTSLASPTPFTGEGCDVLAFTTNLEHAGDIVEKSPMPLAAKRIKRGVSFSEASREEIREMVDRLISNARAAAAVFMTEDPRAVRQLVGEKEIFRELELRATEEHFGLPRTGRAESIEMSKLLLDIVRDLKRVNAHLAAAAYPILESRGLLPSRLKQDIEWMAAADKRKRPQNRQG